jgi:hypothetical protein
LFELAQIRYARVQNALKAGLPGSGVPEAPSTTELQTLFNSALRAARDVENALPPDFPDGQIKVHSLLGNILDDAGHVFGHPEYGDEAAKHYQELITLATQVGDPAGAAKGCREMARLKLKTGELDDALIFAQEAVRKCTTLGQGDPQGLTLSQRLVEVIEATKRLNPGGSS